MTTTAAATAPATPPYSRDAVDVVVALDSNADTGLTSAEAASRLASHGPNEIKSEPPPSIVADRTAAAARPDEPHADRGHDREPR